MDGRTREFVWSAKLSKEDKVAKWPGGQENVLEQIILKLAVLGPGATKGERNLVQITTFDSDQNKINLCICSLTLGSKENQHLADLALFPPAHFTLLEGSGPVHILGNHIVLDEDELSDEEDISESEEEESMQDLREKLKSKGKGGKGNAQEKLKAADEDDDEEDDEEDYEKSAKKKKSYFIDEAEEDDDEDDIDMEDDSEEEEVIEEAPSKKRKLTNGKAPQQQKKSAEKKLTSPDRGSKNIPEQKTPKQQKDAQKSPKSEKKTPGKPAPSSVDEVKALIKKYPGGKPRKEDKFCNWVSSQFKVTNDLWKGELWKWHKKELGL